MERKAIFSSRQSYGVNRNAIQRGDSRKLFRFSRSSIPRLPPIVQDDVKVPAIVNRTVLSENVSQRDSVCSSKQHPGSDAALPRLERTPFKATAHFTLQKQVEESPKTNYSKRNERPELRSQMPSNSPREECTRKNEERTVVSDIFSRGRRKKKDRLSSYKCGASTEVIDDEISGYERRVGFDSLSTTITPNSVKDMKGRFIQSSDVYGEGVSPLLTILDREEDEKKKTSTKINPENDVPKKSERSNPVRERFLKALDTHFYNEFLTTQSGRRMAICEELEKIISGDGKTSLNGLREHLRLQDVLDSWVL